MTEELNSGARLLLSVQRALLGAVPSNLRSVTCEFEESAIRLRFLFDGEISEENEEDVRVVGTEVLSDFFKPSAFIEEIERLDYPADQRTRALAYWAYARKET